MSAVNEDIERLIVRRLDGELNATEELELDRELIRNPDARRLMEEYSRVDELAAAAIGTAMGVEGAGGGVIRSIPAPDRLPLRRRYSPGRWLVPGAVAAGLMALVLAEFQANLNSGSSVNDGVRPTGSQVVAVPEVGAGQEDLMRTVDYGGTRVERSRTGREIFGVLGEDGNLYWIEVDRTLTVRQPKRASAFRFTSEEM